jgi:hypothetical protein
MVHSKLVLATILTFVLLTGWHMPVTAGCSDIATFADSLAPQAELHVSLVGSDSTGDGTAANPFATVQRAAQEAAAGTAIVIHSGVYAGGGLVEIEGTPTAPIWIGGAPGETRPVIDGGSEGLHLVRAKYVIVHDLEVLNSSSNGINADDGGDCAVPTASHHLLFQRLSIHDIGGTGNQDGLKLSGIRDFWVLDCDFAHCGGGMSGSGVDMVGCHRGLIARNRFEDMSGNAVQCKGGSTDVEILRNRMVNAGERAVNIGGSTTFEYFRPPLSTTEPNTESRNIRVLANVFEGATTPVAFVGTVESVVANNTIVSPSRWVLRILQETTSSGGYEFLPCGNNRFENNLIYFERSSISVDVNIGPDTAPETFSFSNNLWYAHDTPEASEPTLPVAETNGIYSENPQFADAAAGDYCIGKDSPAARRGLAPALTNEDIAGTCYRTPPSIGAYEISGGATTPPILYLLLLASEN